MSTPNIMICYMNVPTVRYNTLEDKNSCSIWLDDGDVELDLVFPDHRVLGGLINLLEEVYKEGSKQHDD